MTLFLRIARRIFPDETVAAVFMPAAADYQRELWDAPGRAAALVVRCRWLWAFTVLLLITPLSKSSASRPLLGHGANGGWMLTFLYASLLAGAWWHVQEFALTALVAGALLAWAMRAWNDRHPASVVEPASSASLPTVVQINFSSTRVPGDIAGLMFAAGTILIVVVGLPGFWWFFVAAALASGLVAWQRVRHLSCPTSRG